MRKLHSYCAVRTNSGQPTAYTLYFRPKLASNRHVSRSYTSTSQPFYGESNPIHDPLCDRAFNSSQMIRFQSQSPAHFSVEAADPMTRRDLHRVTLPTWRIDLKNVRRSVLRAAEFALGCDLH
jgi:hypothetical protein